MKIFLLSIATLFTVAQVSSDECFFSGKTKKPKSSSYDMETAVLFRLAKDFGLHAATILQTVNKEGTKLSSYEGVNYKQAIEVEENIFFDYVLDALLQIEEGN